MVLLVSILPSSAQTPETNLPSPATITVDFDRDIQPILETSCLRCHGPEKPKSHFRLDNRPDALKGGDNGVDIVPGHSADSPLIRYVAQLVPDLEMPPVDKGDPLTAGQVSLLRAWIDQGAKWSTNADAGQITYDFSPVVGGTAVHGNAAAFREQNWEKNGANGGLAEFDLTEKLDPETKLSLSGHTTVDDYKLTLDVRRNDLGFIRSGWQQFRKYYDDTGGYLPSFARAAPNGGNDIHLDDGKAWVDLGLTLPNWPQMVLGYEYDYRTGQESTTEWGVRGGILRNILPATRQVTEGVNIIKFDLDHEVQGVTIEDRFRGEFYTFNTSYTNGDARNFAAEKAHEGDSYFQGANTLRFEKKFTDWFFGSAGYLYSKLESEASFTDAVNNTAAFRVVVPQVSVERESHVFNVNGLLGPWDGLTFSTGIESEWSHQHGFGGNDDLLNPVYTNGIALATSTSKVVLSMLSSTYEETTTSETASLRYSKIPFTLLFVDGRFQQQNIGQSDYDLQPVTAYIENTAFTSQLTDLRVGFSTSPWRAVSFSAHYRRYEDASQYQDVRPGPLPIGYPGFIRERDEANDEVEAKLVLRPSAWFKTTLSWQYLTSDFSTVTDATLHKFSPGGALLAGESISQVYSVNATLTPWSRLYLSTTFTYQPVSSITADNGPGYVVPYRGDIYSVVSTATYELNRSTDLFASYTFSAADFGQNNFATGLPVGITYGQHAVSAGVARRLGKNVSARLQYGYYRYTEPTSGGANDYTANSIFATLTFRGP